MRGTYRFHAGVSALPQDAIRIDRKLVRYQVRMNAEAGNGRTVYILTSIRGKVRDQRLQLISAVGTVDFTARISLRSIISSLSRRVTRRHRPLAHSAFVWQPAQAARLEY